MSFALDNMALAGSPVQWALAGTLVLLVFAPQLLPPIARLLGRLTGAEIRRRAGLPSGPRRPRAQPRVEVLPPERPTPTLRADSQPPLAPTAGREAAHVPVWWVPAVVCAAIGVILWILLHGR